MRLALLLLIALNSPVVFSQDLKVNYYPLRTGKIEKTLLKSVLKNSETLATQNWKQRCKKRFH